MATSWTADGWAAPVELEWTATPECPPASDVLGEIERILDGASGPQKNVHARADVAHDARGPWKVTLVTETDGTTGRRTFAAETCRALADATALILAMTVNPNLTAGEPPPPRPAPEPETTPEPAPPRAPAPTSIRWVRFSVSASVVGDVGALPSASLAPQLALAWLPGRSRIELAVAYALPQRGFATRPGEGADFSLWTVSAQVGFAWPLGAFEVGPLAGAALERFGAQGFGGTSSFDQRAEIIAIRGGARAAWFVSSRVALRVVGLASLPLSRPSFVVVNPAPTANELVHRPAALGGQAAFGVEWQFF